MSQNNIKNILAKLADITTDFAEKLTDKEYKDLCEGLGDIYKEVDKLPSSSPNSVPIAQNLFQTNVTAHNSCVCQGTNKYKCYKYYRFVHCCNRETITMAVPLITRVYALLCPPHNNVAIVNYTPNDKYIIHTKPGYNITSILVNEANAKKTIDFIYQVSYKSRNESFKVRCLLYLCLTNLIFSEKDIFVGYGTIASGTNSPAISNVSLLNEIIEFFSQPLLGQLVETNGVNNYIYTPLSPATVAEIITSLLTIKSTILGYSEVQVNLAPPIQNKHPMSTRQKRQYLLKK